MFVHDDRLVRRLHERRIDDLRRPRRPGAISPTKPGADRSRLSGGASATRWSGSGRASRPTRADRMGDPT